MAAAPVRQEILALVRGSDTGLTAADVAAKTGLRLSTARSQLDGLLADGLLVKARASAGVPRRPPWRYRGVAPDPPPSTYRFLLTALLDDLTGTDDRRQRAAAAGRHWGRMLATAGTGDGIPVPRLIAVMDALGFSPQAHAGGTEMHLLTCPYLELVGKHPDAMCHLHAGVIAGVLEHAGDDAEVVLEPFAAAGACVVRLPRPTLRA